LYLAYLDYFLTQPEITGAEKPAPR
jgi:hypothetical protein